MFGFRIPIRAKPARQPPQPSEQGTAEAGLGWAGLGWVWIGWAGAGLGHVCNGLCRSLCRSSVEASVEASVEPIVTKSILFLAILRATQRCTNAGAQSVDHEADELRNGQPIWPLQWPLQELLQCRSSRQALAIAESSHLPMSRGCSVRCREVPEKGEVSFIAVALDTPRRPARDRVWVRVCFALHGVFLAVCVRL